MIKLLKIFVSRKVYPSVLTFAFTTKLALFMPRESRKSNWSPIDSKCSKNRN